jgi:tetratricopeptide (TPR) repeat protein
MRIDTMPMRPTGLYGIVVLIAVGMLGGGSALRGQTLPFRVSYLGSTPGVCPAWSPGPAAEPEARRAAVGLSSDATQAVVLGDLLRASELLERALELDAGSAELHYRYGRVLEDLGERVGAAEAYCRVVALEETEEGPTRDAAARVDSLTKEARGRIPESAHESFRRAVRFAGNGRFGQAAEEFGAAAADAPEWAEAAYNHGVALALSDRHAAAAGSLRRYLELSPDAEDAMEVSRRIGQLEVAARSVARASSTRALTLGLVAPGLGQFYTGRPEAGLAVLSAVGGAVAAGYLIQEVDVRCLTPLSGAASCPPDRVLSRHTRRPVLRNALVVAAGFSVLGAVEAWLVARRTESVAPPRIADGSSRTTIRIGPRALGVGPNGVEAVLLDVSLRR